MSVAYSPAPRATHGKGIREDIPFYASLIDDCSSAGDLRGLRRAHGRILAVGIAHHDFLRTKLCAAYARCARIPEALHIFSRANRRPAFLYNSLIRSLASLDRCFPAALRLFRLMRAEGARPDHRTLAAVLRSCAGLTSLRLGRETHAAAIAAGYGADPVVANSLISMYGKCGDLGAARQVFDRIAERRNLVSWTAMIAACGDHGSPAEEVKSLLDGMLTEGGGTVDAAAMTAVLAACARGGLTELGREVFDAIREGQLGGVRPGVEHYTCMVELLGKARQVDEAEALVAKMEVEPDEALWRALLGVQGGRQAGRGRAVGITI